MVDERIEDSHEAGQERHPAQKSPWNPSAFYGIAVFFGLGAAGVIAGINYGRLGRETLKWPIISVSLISPLLFEVMFFG